MAQTAMNPDRTGPQGMALDRHRSRSAWLLALSGLAFLLLIGGQGLDWGAGLPMILGELIGLVTPVAVIAAVAGLLIWGSRAVR